MEKKKIKEEQPSIIKDDEIDLIALIMIIWNGRKTIYSSVVVCVIIGVLVAFLSPAKYKVTATLLPSAEKSRSSMGGLSALAGMAGVNLGSMMGESNTIPAEIYPEVVSSYPFLNELIHEKYYIEEFHKSMSIYEYILQDSIQSFGNKIIKYTIRLPWTIKDAVFTKDKHHNNNEDFGVLSLTKEDVKVLDSVNELIEVEVDVKTGLVSVSVEASEPVLTAQFVQKSLELLEKYMIDYKTKQARENERFVQESYEEKKSTYEKLQKEFFLYKDRHRNIISERSNPEFQRLSEEYELASSIYSELAKQLEQAKIAVKEQTPAFTVLEPAKVPIMKSSPKKLLILVVSIFLGGFIGIGIIIGKLVWENIKISY
nr:Wzz/FepE/Etk N-terminal domain-containing protein [uncultured Carboxylicivirga sp.]